jgi:hypothetical protein
MRGGGDIWRQWAGVTWPTVAGIPSFVGILVARASYCGSVLLIQRRLYGTSYRVLLPFRASSRRVPEKRRSERTHGESGARCVLLLNEAAPIEANNLNRRNNPNWVLLDTKRSGRQLSLRMSVLVWGIQLVLYRVWNLTFHVGGRARAETLKNGELRKTLGLNRLEEKWDRVEPHRYELHVLHSLSNVVDVIT